MGIHDPKAEALFRYLDQKRNEPVINAEFVAWWHKHNDDSMCYETARRTWQACYQHCLEVL